MSCFRKTVSLALDPLLVQVQSESLRTLAGMAEMDTAVAMSGLSTAVSLDILRTSICQGDLIDYTYLMDLNGVFLSDINGVHLVAYDG